MGGDNKLGFTALGLGSIVGEKAGQYIQKLDSVATNTPKNEPLFNSSIAKFTTLGVVTNSVHENAPKITAVATTVANDIYETAKDAYDWAAEHSLVGQMFGKDAVDKVNNAIFSGGLIGLGYNLIKGEN